MSVLEKEATPIRSRPSRSPARPSRNGRGTAPRLRPAALPAPTIAPAGETTPARACRPAPIDRREPPACAASPVSSWRLTERGIAVVLVLVAMVAVAALAVVVPTAVRVTGDNYRPAGASQLTRP